ncbi:MAG: hypothetical protein Q9162_004193 [Coniocarpon cinnabarinum]
MTILVGIAPSITAGKAIASRERVASAFERYYKAKGHERASQYARNRYETCERNGVPLKDIARYEVGGANAVLINTTPAAFWMLLLIYARHDLLRDIRAEIDAVKRVQNEGNGTSRHLDITSLKERCPLFFSTYQEVLRYRSMGTSVRQVMEDTILDGQWLLKKGAMIQMPSRIIHSSKELWGSDVQDFNRRRFMHNEQQKTPTGKRSGDACFRAFGGGKTLCPGRHFATNEVLAVVGMFVARFDMSPCNGQWSLPTADKTNVASVIMEPDHDVDAMVQSRPGVGDSQWVFALGVSGDVLALVAEDR